MGALWSELGIGVPPGWNDEDDALILETVAGLLGFRVPPPIGPPASARARLLDLLRTTPPGDPGTLFVATAVWQPGLQAGLATTGDGRPWRIWAWPDSTAETRIVRLLQQDLAGRRVVLATGGRMVLPSRLAERLGDGHFLQVVDNPRHRPPVAAGVEAFEIGRAGGRRRIWSHDEADEANDRFDRRPAPLIGWSLLATDDDRLSAAELAEGFRRLRIAYRRLREGVGTGPEWRSEPVSMPPGLILTWLALALSRAAELRTGEPWPAVRAVLEQGGTPELHQMSEAPGGEPPGEA